MPGCDCSCCTWLPDRVACDGNQVGVAMTPDIYHEKQIKELCALHSLNNLFQDSSAFAKSELDHICYALSPDNWFNPHKSLLGTGNYDINVIMAALTTKGCGVVWFDKRKDPQVIMPDKVVGFILNVPSEYRLGPVQLPLRRKHWIAIRSIGGIYYNLDSKLDTPEIIGQEEELIRYLREELQHKDKELFVVVTQEVEKTRDWCHAFSTNTVVDSSLAPHTSTNNTDNALRNGQDPHAGQAFNPPGPINALHNGQDSRTGQAFNPPGLSFIDQESSVPDTCPVADATRASQETL